MHTKKEGQKNIYLRQAFRWRRLRYRPRELSQEGGLPGKYIIRGGRIAVQTNRDFTNRTTQGAGLLGKWCHERDMCRECGLQGVVLQEMSPVDRQEMWADFVRETWAAWLRQARDMACRTIRQDYHSRDGFR